MKIATTVFLPRGICEKQKPISQERLEGASKHLGTDFVNLKFFDSSLPVSADNSLFMMPDRHHPLLPSRISVSQRIGVGSCLSSLLPTVRAARVA